MEILPLIKDVGFPIALVIILLWERKRAEDRNHAEQARLAARLSKVEDYIRDELVAMLTRATQAIEKHEKCQVKDYINKQEIKNYVKK